MVKMPLNLVCNIFSSLYKISNESEKTKDHTLQGVFQMLKIIAIGIGIIIVVSILFDKNPLFLAIIYYYK